MVERNLLKRKRQKENDNSSTKIPDLTNRKETPPQSRLQTPRPLSEATQKKVKTIEKESESDEPTTQIKKTSEYSFPKNTTIKIAGARKVKNYEVYTANGIEHLMQVIGGKDMNTSYTNKPESSLKTEPETELQVLIEDRDSILKAIKENKSGILGEMRSQRPIDKIEVHLKKGVETSNLLAIFKFDALINPNLDNYDIVTDTEKHIKKIFPDGKVKSGILTLTEGNTRFGLSLSSNRGPITIHTGEITYPDGRNVTLSPKPQRDNIDNTLEGFIKLLRECTNAIYIAHKAEQPKDQALMLTPPEEPPLPSTPITIFQKEPDMLDIFQTEEPQVSFDEDIGGQEEAKIRLRKLNLPAERYKKFGLKPPKGIVIHGPQGTGKTLLVKALAFETNARLVHVDRRHSVEELEKIIDLLSNAKNKSKRAIIFFNRIDEINGPAQHTIISLLRKIDKLTNITNIRIVGTINNITHFRQDTLDSELFKKVEVNLPKKKERREIFNIHMKNAKKIADREIFCDDIDFEKILRQTENMNGAHIKTIIEETLIEKSFQDDNTGEASPVSTDDIERQIIIYKNLLNRPNHEFYT